MWTALGGAIGSCLRVLFTFVVPSDSRRAPWMLAPWMRFAENVRGALLLGLVMTALLTSGLF